jgi:ABC-type sugar transport system ATPase subunit
MTSAHLNNENPPLLVARNVEKRYAGVHALKQASFELRAGEVHALMGENGAGKSTLARILSGSTQADGGEILIDGQPASIGDPLSAQRAGIGIIHQELDLFPHLTVGENIVIGNLRFPEHWRVSAPEIEAFCQPYLQRVGLACNTREVASSLPIGQQQLLVIARALSMNARVLIMDEPTSALPEDAAARLFELIPALKARGVAIVYVSHKMDEIFRLSDRITVLRDGATVGTRQAAATDADELIRMMVGRPLEQRARSTREGTHILLQARNLTTRKLRSVDFELRAGEVLGIAGLVGAGRSELGAALFGLDRIERGSLELKGRPFEPQSPAHAIQSGLGLLPEDRKLQGLMMQMSVRENGTLSILSRLSRAGFIRRHQERERMDELRRRLRLKCSSQDVAVGTLSGGNQQKALLARTLLAEPDVLFLDDPARGIDVGAKEDIYALIDELAQRGKGILLVSSELPELLRLSDRIMVLNQGHVTALFQAHEATQERIMAAATSQIAA